MSAGEHMNYIALNQSIFNKAMTLGGGPKEGTSETPLLSPQGIPVYLNGTHVIPEPDQMTTFLSIGSMTHPYAMMGMPDRSGEVSYEFWVTDKEYFIVVRLQLEEDGEEESSEAAADILAPVTRHSLPPNIADTEENYSTIACEMLQLHFDSLFESYDHMDELSDWSFNDDALHSFIKYHFERKEANQ